jgi:hypothetical protein
MRMGVSSKLRVIEMGGSAYLVAIVLALIIALTLAASAQADDPVSGSPPAPTEVQESPGGQPSSEQAPAEAQAPAPSEGASEAEGAASGGATEAPAATPEETAPAPEETVAVTPPEEQVVVPAPEETAPVEPPVVETPVIETPVVTLEEAPVTIAAEEPVAAEVTGETRQGGSIEGTEEPASKTPAGERTEGMGELDATAPRSTLLETPAAALAARTDTGASEGSIATGAILPVIATIAGTEVEGPGGGPPASGHGASAAQRAGSFSCELSQLGGHLTDNCAAGWLGTPRLLSAAAPSTGLVTVASSLVAATIAGSPSEGGHGGSAVSSPPVGPAPSPAPGGAAGAAPGAAGGFAPLSTFLTLAGLLLLGAPRVLRRLRLSCEPWLAGCFVLVPERPD